MTEETGSTGTPEASEPLGATPGPAAEGAEVTESQDMFSSSEGMVSFGAGLVIACWVIFWLILDDYSVGTVTVLVAALALMIPRASRAFVEQIAPTSVLMRAVGYSLAVLGVVNLALDLRFITSALDSISEVLGALLAYVGFAAAFLGARSIDTN